LCASKIPFDYRKGNRVVLVRWRGVSADFYPTTNKWKINDERQTVKNGDASDFPNLARPICAFIGAATMKNDEVEIYLEMKLDGERFGKRADLFTDGVDEFWIPHSQIIEKTHIKDRRL
jgi:hypothetical protein